MWSVACGSASRESPESPEPTAPTVRLDGVYQSTTTDGPFSLLEFHDDGNYRAWRFGGGPCANLAPGEAPPESCAEVGHYELTKDRLTLTDDRTGHAESLAFKAKALAGGAGGTSLTKPGSVTAQELVGSGVDVVQPTPRSTPVASSVEITGQGGQPQQLVQASTGGLLCRAGCWGAAGLGAASVSVLCTVGNVITVGGVTIPCTYIIVASAGAAGAGASLCSDALCPQ